MGIERHFIRTSSDRKIPPAPEGYNEQHNFSRQPLFTKGSSLTLHTNYDASAIEVLTGLDPVRKRPGMYTLTDNPNHLAHEVIDNSVDEVIAGFATKITVTLHSDQSLSVSDNGRGIPVDLHHEENIPGVEVIMTRLHSGAKFSSKNYLYSGGLHGVGVSVVNALSNRLNVQIRRNGIHYEITFENGECVQKLTEIERIGKRNTGTSIRFWPNAQYFDSGSFNIRKLKRLMLAKAVLCAGLELIYVDEINPENSETWSFEEGLGNYLVSQLNGSARVPADSPIIFHRNAEDIQVDCAVVWTPEASQLVAESYVNLIPTESGGTHVNGFRTGSTEAIREFCELRNLLPRGIRITAEDVWRHCSFVLSVHAEDPQFSGQAKERLTSKNVGSTLTSMARNAFSLWLHQHVSAAEQIAELAIENARRREKSNRSIKRKKHGIGPALPGKLTDCTSDRIDKTELFLVEGDSAGGSAKQARNRETQAILPLRGKILNTWEIASTDVLASEEVHSIAVALGVDPGAEEINGLRYGKICILADADADGAHIATLLCALFVKHFPTLVRNSKVYVAKPPLYRVDAGKQVLYALDDTELGNITAEIRATQPHVKITVQRFKGLGEMNPSQLKETTMNPATRRLQKLHIESSAQTDRMLNMLLAKKQVADRKAWLAEVGNRAQL